MNSGSRRTFAIVGVTALAVTGATAAISTTSDAGDCSAVLSEPTQNQHHFINQWLGSNDARNFGELDSPENSMETYGGGSGTMILCVPDAAADELDVIGTDFIRSIGSGGYGPRTVTVTNADDQTAKVTWNEAFPDRS